MRFRLGSFRLVLLIGKLAIKIPRLTRLGKGLRCNRWEREVWQVWRLKFGWRNLAPVVASDPWGIVIVMPRAEQPVTEQEMLSADEPDIHPATDTELKVESFGRIAGRVVAIDYGLPDSDMVAERRVYYANTGK